MVVGNTAVQKLCLLNLDKEGCISMCLHLLGQTLFIRYDVLNLYVVAASQLGCSISVFSALVITAHANNQFYCVYCEPSVVCTVSNVKLITSWATEGFPQCCSTIYISMWSLVEAEVGQDPTTTAQC